MKKYENFIKALKNLAEGARSEPPYTPVVQTGIVGLFAICYELSWKLMKEMLQEHGRIPNNLASPRTIIKLAYQHGMVSDEETWLAILKTRNELTTAKDGLVPGEERDATVFSRHHIYSDKDSRVAIENIRSKYLSAFDELRMVIERDWLPEA